MNFLWFCKGAGHLPIRMDKVKGIEKEDTFIVPKEFLGTWHMPEHYREMIVVETNQWLGNEG